MRISIFGLGYVGAVSAACLAVEGHTVVGVDPNTTKADLINKGLSPIVEDGLDSLISRAVMSGRLRVIEDPYDAVASTDVSLVCVGTPSCTNGNLDLSHVKTVCEELGSALRQKEGYHVIVMRSTMLPGSMRGTVIPLLEGVSKKRAGIDFGVCINPEFLREGLAIYDYHHPPKTVIGETDRRAGDVLLSLYEHLDVPIVRTNIETAEMVKYTDNAWHAVKVAFANEIGKLSKAVGIDGVDVMRIFCKDTKLNLSAYYMRPGFAFGGSCLPKDVRALMYKGKMLDVDLPLINSILESNQKQIDHGLDLILRKGSRRIGILGFAFKAGTDDLRESPMIQVIERLLGKGYSLKLYDRCVNVSALTGANQDYIMNRISHISQLMVSSADEVLDFADTVVIGNSDEEFRNVLDRIRPWQSVVDLVRIDQKPSGGQYDGICW